MPWPDQYDPAQYKIYSDHQNKPNGILYLQVNTPIHYNFLFELTGQYFL